ncbi:MAG: hypothetical protein EA401_01565 [Planctomycetota bacterium]|nr:MAG: hypothetical protein EA401_01565 [Planctomycetota bacterium]
MSYEQGAGVPHFALRLAYDGSDFAGWWRQPGLRCVASDIDQAGTAIGEPDLQCTGIARTDRGVHAREQIARVSCQRPWTTEHLCRALNHHLATDCRCLSAARVTDDWDIRASCRSKTYTYACDCSPWGDPFARRWAWRPPTGGDWQGLQNAAKILVGKHDFRCFIRRGEYRHDTVCTLQDITWTREGNIWRCGIQGDRFIYRLARSLVGCMWSAARDPTQLAHINEALEGGAPHPATMQQAPAHGLCLEKVELHQPLQWSA